MSCLAPSNIAITPMRVLFAQKATMCIEVVADVSSSLNSQYFEMTHPNGTQFYVWYNVGGAGVDPALVGKTGIPVAIAANASAEAVATATATALDANSNWIASVSNSNDQAVVLKTSTYQDMAVPTDGAATTTFTFEKIYEGFEIDVGYTEGDLEPNIEHLQTDVTAHQKGGQKLTSLSQGVNISATVVLQELTDENIERFIEKSLGGSYTVSGNKLVGFGSAQIGTNMINKAARLIFHPVSLAANVTNKDWCLMAAVAKPTSILFSGENPQKMTVEFECFSDELVSGNIDKMYKGDHTLI